VYTCRASARVQPGVSFPGSGIGGRVVYSPPLEARKRSYGGFNFGGGGLVARRERTMGASWWCRER
jgi:hypothetical protein